MKSAISKVALTLGFLLMIGIIVSRDFRLMLGLAIDPVMTPFAPLKFHITIFILAILTGIYSNLIQKYTVDFQKLKNFQKIQTEFQKEYIDAMKKNNKPKLEQLEKRKREIQVMQAEVLNMQMKSMGYTLIVTIPIFSWLWEKVAVSYELLYGGDLYGNITQTLPEAFVSTINPELFKIVVPFSGVVHVAETFIFPWWLFWYLVCSIALGQIIKNVMKVGV